MRFSYFAPYSSLIRGTDVLLRLRFCLDANDDDDDGVDDERNAFDVSISQPENHLRRQQKLSTI